jgi:1-acyl-sn-glycerol-3-phosphate acyltransferase
VEGRPGILTNLWHFVALCLLVVLLRILNRIKIFGKENIPKRGERGVLILSNHISALDPLLIGITAMPRFSAVRWQAAAKEELFKIPVVGWIVRSIGGFPVRRGEHDEVSMLRMIASLRSDVLVVFPEGTWSKTGDLLPGRAGVGKVIYRARPSKIIPVAVKGTDRILPRECVVPKVGKEGRIIYGQPMDLSRYFQAEESLDTFRNIVEEIMAEIGRLHRTI